MSSTSKPIQPDLPEPVRPLDADRARQIADMLDESPKGVGRPVTDREAWERIGRHSTFQRVVSEATALLDEPIPELTEDLYLDHVRTGGEEVYNEYHRVTRSRLTKLVLAECVENDGRFVSAIHEALDALWAEPTWVHAFHDPKLRNWTGEAVEIDLNAAAVAWSAATADYLLGNRLEEATRSRLRTEFSRRIVQPYQGMLDGELLYVNQPRPFTWLTLNHNWNAAALAHVTGVGLAVVEPREERAAYVAAAERYIRNFLSGFPADGSCSEGVGYWGGGFGSFVLLAETLWQATHGAIDLFSDKHVALIAQYGARMEITPGVYPAFADCPPDVAPSPDLMRFLSQRYGLGLRKWEEREPGAESLPAVGVYAFPNSATRVATGGTEKRQPEVALRSWFSDAGLYVGRSATPGGLGVAFKGGHNAEHHNHNDVGSFVVAANGKLLLTDPGSELYTSRTFGPDRYESNVLNSYGHSVPLVGGRLQSAGRGAEARVLEKDFKDGRDVVAYDLRAAYDVSGLRRLQRTFAFSRQGQGSLTVTDEVEFTSRTVFGTALVTFGQWEQVAPDALIVFEDGDALRVDLRVQGGACEIASEEIEEDVRAENRPTRISINMNAPVTQATVEMTVTAGGA